MSLQPSKPLPTQTTNINICQHIDSLQNSINTYTVEFHRPKNAKDRKKRCSRLIKKFRNQANKSNGRFYAHTYPNQSCQITGNSVKLTAEFNLKALKYVSSYIYNYYSNYSIKIKIYIHTNLVNIIIKMLCIFPTGVLIKKTTHICYTIIAVNLDHHA